MNDQLAYTLSHYRNKSCSNILWHLTRWQKLKDCQHQVSMQMWGNIPYRSVKMVWEPPGQFLTKLTNILIHSFYLYVFTQYSCLENPMDGGAWLAAVHGVAEGQTWLSNFTFTFHFHALEEEMATHSSVLAWRIPGTGEPGGLPSMGSHRSDLAATQGKWKHLSTRNLYINIHSSFTHNSHKLETAPIQLLNRKTDHDPYNGYSITTQQWKAMSHWYS